MRTVSFSIESLASIKLVMKYDDTVTSTATGFFWRHDSQLFLVTNRHNVTGRNTETGKCIDKTLAVPNQIVGSAICRGGYRGNKSPIREEISIKWELGKESKWLQHPKLNLVDVVMWPLNSSKNQILVPINENSQGNFILEVSNEVFLLGYPLGIDVEGTPIWKRGTLASEPEMDVDGLPKLLVDTASNKGMSGSPVINKRYIGRPPLVFRGTDPHVQLVGVYSGRTQRNGNLDAQLGDVWKASVLEEIVKSGVKYSPE